MRQTKLKRAVCPINSDTNLTEKYLNDINEHRLHRYC